MGWLGGYVFTLFLRLYAQYFCATVDFKPVTPDLLNLIAVSAIGLYEIIVRIVPTVADYSAVSWLIRILKLVSDKLNIKK